MTPEDWLKAFREMTDSAVSRAEGLWGTEKGRVRLGRGAGGDTTVVLDKVMEDAVIERLEAVGDVRLVSEESGIIEFGTPEVTVVADPLDGSFNAKMGISVYAISLALAISEPVMGNVVLGYVRNLVTNDEYHAIRGKGAFLNGGPIRSSTRERVRVLGMEPHPNTELSLRQSLALVDHDTRLRSLGCMSLDLCFVAQGIFDALVDIRGQVSRVVDMAAGYLIIQEAGGVVEDGTGGTISNALLDMETRVDFVASGNRGLQDNILTVLREKGFVDR